MNSKTIPVLHTLNTPFTLLFQYRQGSYSFKLDRECCVALKEAPKESNMGTFGLCRNLKGRSVVRLRGGVVRLGGRVMRLRGGVVRLEGRVMRLGGVVRLGGRVMRLGGRGVRLGGRVVRLR
jgi:hypothetical protein